MAVGAHVATFGLLLSRSALEWGDRQDFARKPSLCLVLISVEMYTATQIMSEYVRTTNGVLRPHRGCLLELGLGWSLW